MKKFLMAVGLMLVLSAGVFAQAGKTNYYRYVETVDTETGVKSNENQAGMYITFTGNSCYESDEKGIQHKRASGPSEVYAFQGEQNNYYVYRYRHDPYAALVPGMYVDTYTFIFSKDYKRLNHTRDDRVERYIHPGSEKKVHIYVLADPPSKGPATFY